MYYENIFVLEAEEDVRFGNIADLPYLAKKGRDDFLKERKKIFNPKWKNESKKELTTKDLAAMLAGGLRG